MEQQAAKKKHIVNIENRAYLNFSGIDDVVNSDSSVVVCKVSGMLMVIRGESLKIKRFDTKNGDLVVDGIFSSLEYLENKQRNAVGFFGKLFG